jgi:ABC-type anion transport system duplicated permease subunit
VTGLGKLLVIFCGIMIVVGLIVILAAKANLPLGRLPGDITYRGKNSTIYFPLVTCVVLSVILSMIMWLINRFWR